VINKLLFVRKAVQVRADLTNMEALRVRIIHRSGIRSQPQVCASRPTFAQVSDPAFSEEINWIILFRQHIFSDPELGEGRGGALRSANWRKNLPESLFCPLWAPNGHQLSSGWDGVKFRAQQHSQDLQRRPESPSCADPVLNLKPDRNYIPRISMAMSAGDSRFLLDGRALFMCLFTHQ